MSVQEAKEKAALARGLVDKQLDHPLAWSHDRRWVDCLIGGNHDETLDAAGVARIFGVGLERLHTTTITAEDVFHTYREREMWSRIRRFRGLALLQRCRGVVRRSASRQLALRLLCQNDCGENQEPRGSHD